MTLCPHHVATIDGARQAISGHRRNKTTAAIARSIARQCPDCTAPTKETA